jgi:release factor glutamine methyltransferase
MTINALLRESAGLIASSPNLSFQSPTFEARLLFEFACGQSHAWLIAHGDTPLADVVDSAVTNAVNSVINSTDIEYFKKCVKQRIDGKPLAFIIGTQDFWTLTLEVSDCTLIPRQDSEILVETAITLPLTDDAKVLDLGTGTGAIALAIAKERATWSVIGLDRIEAAVNLAQNNAKRNQVNATFLTSNWFDVFVSDTSAKFDLIVSNPPYVEQDSDYLKQGDLRFEPLSALISGLDGLDDIRHIVSQATDYLSVNGYLIIEHGHEQGESVNRLLIDAGFTQVVTKKDLNNLPRITLGCWTRTN